MTTRTPDLLRPVIGVVAILTVLDTGNLTLRGAQDDQRFRFRTGVDLVNVTVTVTDRAGRFVPGLTAGDFTVFEDGVAQQISHFSNERVPVSLGIALDSSGSMEGDKIEAAAAALDRFLGHLLGPEDEVFLFRFSDLPVLVEGWTSDLDRLRRRLGRPNTRGGTALYDTVVESVALARTGQHRKKALLVISDGNDTESQATVGEVRQIIRESEVLVYAIGIDAGESGGGVSRPRLPQPPTRIPIPFPFPGGRRNPPLPQPPLPGGGRVQDARVNIGALRDMTDDSGGRTEIVRVPRDLDPATAGIADELSRQYFLAYAAAAEPDGRWHSIRVEVRNPSYLVRARRGYMADTGDRRRATPRLSSGRAGNRVDVSR
ncbi:MAG: VWA domain-containing protein [Acidobacteriota bacterium]